MNYEDNKKLWKLKSYEIIKNLEYKELWNYKNYEVTKNYEIMKNYERIMKELWRL